MFVRFVLSKNFGLGEYIRLSLICALFDIYSITSYHPLWDSRKQSATTWVITACFRPPVTLVRNLGLDPR